MLPSKFLKTVSLNWKPWLKKVFIFLKKKSVYYIERIILEKSGSFLGLRVAVLNVGFYNLLTGNVKKDVSINLNL